MTDLTFEPLLSRYASRVLTTIADESRRRIVDFLFQSPDVTFGQIAEALEMTNGNLGSHLKALRSVGLVDRDENYLTDAAAVYRLTPLAARVFEAVAESFLPQIEPVLWTNHVRNVRFHSHFSRENHAPAFQPGELGRVAAMPLRVSKKQVQLAVSV